jgi:DNA polymerase-3 subunit alpha
MDSIVKPLDAFKRAKELGQTALAITDHGTLSAAHDSLKASKETGVKLIMGCEFNFVDDVNDKEARMRHIILLAKNAIGYKNILTLSYRGFQNNIVLFKKVHPRIDWKLLEEYSEGLICTTACGNGIIGQLINNHKIDEAKQVVEKLKGIFGENLLIEIQSNALTRNDNLYSYKIDQQFTNKQAIAIAQELGIKIVATNDVHYLTKDQSEDQDVLLSIGSGQPIESGNRLKYNVKDFYLKSEAETRATFERGAYKIYGEQFVNDICGNTMWIADQCETPDWIDPKFTNPSGKELPEFPVKDQEDYQEFLAWLNNQSDEIKGKQEDVSYLRYICEKEFSNKTPVDKIEEYKARLEEELDVFEFCGVSSYMLIVADYVNWARKNNIRVGLGRGSAGGSLVAFILEIHAADPIKYGLIFARFYNKFKAASADIDLDFSPSGREKVISYVRNKYGNEYVAHVSNVSTITPKVYARDIARAFEFGADRKKAVQIGTSIADSIPAEIKTIKGALDVPLFGDFAIRYPQLERFSTTVAGKARAWSTHAAGVVISKRPLLGLVPLRIDKEGTTALEYEKERAEANGLVKMDFLGLETLDIIDRTYELIKLAGKEPPPINLNNEEYDEATYNLISSGNTFCVFQLGGSSGTIDLCRKIKPKSIKDISDINALARPSAKEIRIPFIKVKNGEEKVELLHPSLERSFGGTYGFGLYEECLMYLAQDVAGWDLHDADKLRKLTKEKGKNPEKAAQWRKEFIEGAVNNKNIPEEMATKIWDEVVSAFSGYGFNLSHSVLYSMISYHTAYLKAHFPVEFLVANLISEVKSNTPQSKTNIIKIKTELRQHKVKIMPPDVNHSELTYKLVGDNTLMTGLDALKFMGKDAIPEIISKRPYNTFQDFLMKMDGRKVSSRAIQALAASGCLDTFGLSRKIMYLYASDYKKKVQVWSKKDISKRNEFIYPFPQDVGEWTIAERYALEQFYLGEGLSGTIKDRYPNFFVGNFVPFKTLPKKYPEPEQEIEVKDSKKKKQKKHAERIPVDDLFGEVVDAFKFKVKKEESIYRGREMQRITVKDIFGTELSVILFPDQLNNVEDCLKFMPGKKESLGPGMAIRFAGNISWYEGELSVAMDTLYDMKSSPSLPEDLISKKVSLPRSKKKSTPEEDLNKNKEEILEEMEDDFAEEGISEVDDDLETIDHFS